MLIVLLFLVVINIIETGLVSAFNDYVNDGFIYR